MAMVPVQFTKIPPFKTHQTAETKIYELARRPWGESVTCHALRCLFDEHIVQVSEATKFPIKLSFSLKAIIFQLCKKYDGKLEWREASQIGLLALRISHTLDGIHQPPKNYRNEFFCSDLLVTIFESLGILENYGTFRLVCHQWKTSFEKAYFKFTESNLIAFRLNRTWKVVEDIKTITRLNSRCRILDLSEIPSGMIPPILSRYPQLQKLTYCGSYDLRISLEFFCPDIEELVIKPSTYILRRVHVLNFRKLRRLELDSISKVNQVDLPDSIESISLKYCDKSKRGVLRVPEAASVKNLYIERSDIGRVLDLRGAGWRNLEVIEIIDCVYLGSIIFPPEMLNLRKIVIDKCPSIESLDLSGILLPELEYLQIIGIQRFVLPRSDVAVKLTDFVLRDVTHNVHLNMQGFFSLKELSISDLDAPQFSIPAALTLLEIKACNFEGVIPQFNGKLSHLKILYLNDIMGFQEELSLENSTQLIECYISSVFELNQLTLPPSVSALSILRISQTGELVINGGEDGDWQAIRELVLCAFYIKGISRVDLSQSQYLHSLKIVCPDKMTFLALPENGDRLRNIELVSVSFEELNLSNFENLESLIFKPRGHCELTLGNKPMLDLDKFELSEKVSMTGPIKKRRKKIH